MSRPESQRRGEKMKPTKDKLCGNCSGHHKYEDCPIINLQFPPTKKAYAKLEEDAEKWNRSLAGKDFNYYYEIVELFRKNKEIIIGCMKQSDANFVYNVSDELIEELENALNETD